jgi:hypothetical protein
MDPIEHDVQIGLLIDRMASFGFLVVIAPGVIIAAAVGSGGSVNPEQAAALMADLYESGTLDDDVLLVFMC